MVASDCAPANARHCHRRMRPIAVVNGGVKTESAVRATRSSAFSFVGARSRIRLCFAVRRVSLDPYKFYPSAPNVFEWPFYACDRFTIHPFWTEKLTEEYLQFFFGVFQKSIFRRLERKSADINTEFSGFFAGRKSSRIYLINIASAYIPKTSFPKLNLFYCNNESWISYSLTLFFSFTCLILRGINIFKKQSRSWKENLKKT